MNAVKEGSFNKRGRNGLEQMTGFQHIGDSMLGITYKYHRSRSLMSSFATVKRFVSQVVLHSVNQYSVNRTALLLFKLVPCHHIPIAYQA